MTFKEAMAKCRAGARVCHPDMNKRWWCENTPGGVVQRSDVGGEIAYHPTERDRRREDWVLKS